MKMIKVVRNPRYIFRSKKIQIFLCVIFHKGLGKFSLFVVDYAGGSLYRLTLPIWKGLLITKFRKLVWGQKKADTMTPPILRSSNHGCIYVITFNPKIHLNCLSALLSPRTALPKSSR